MYIKTTYPSILQPLPIFKYSTEVYGWMAGLKMQSKLKMYNPRALWAQNQTRFQGLDPHPPSWACQIILSQRAASVDQIFDRHASSSKADLSLPASSPVLDHSKVWKITRSLACDDPGNGNRDNEHLSKFTMSIFCSTFTQNTRIRKSVS